MFFESRIQLLKNVFKPFVATLMVTIPGIAACSKPKEPTFGTRSLTSVSSNAKKYYLGWGEVLDGSMGNETLYDVRHTQEVFTKEMGGNYAGTALDSETSNAVNAGEINSAFDKIKNQITPSDMFLQYSSGHGYPGGLGVGVEYDSMVEKVLSYNARETVVFTMACFSGTMIDAFRQKKSQWSNFRDQGKTLFVMASSPSDQESSTGPGTDENEAGPDGSAGSAFGHSIWKSLYESDGYVDGIKDGFISIGEITEFTKDMTNKIGGHVPQFDGSYYPQIIMVQAQ